MSTLAVTALGSLVGSVINIFKKKTKDVDKTLEAQAEMRKLGFSTVMTSTASDEYAQHFYQKLGYTAIGGFGLPGESYELVFSKKL